MLRFKSPNEIKKRVYKPLLTDKTKPLLTDKTKLLFLIKDIPNYEKYKSIYN
jgi:hypothetical protein